MEAASPMEQGAQQGARKPRTRSGGAPQRTFKPELVPGAIVMLRCYDGIERRGRIRTRERTFIAAENDYSRQSVGGCKSAAVGGNESAALRPTEVLVVVQDDLKSSTEVVLVWKVPEDGRRSSPGVPDGLWDTHVKLVERSPLRNQDEQRGKTIPLDIFGAASGLSAEEQGTLRAMQGISGGANAELPVPIVESGDEGDDEGSQADEARLSGTPLFARRYLEGEGEANQRMVGNPGLLELLEEMPRKRLVQSIFKAAGVPVSEWESPRLCEAVHLAADVIAVDLTSWVEANKRAAAVFAAENDLPLPSRSENDTDR